MAGGKVMKCCWLPRAKRSHHPARDVEDERADDAGRKPTEQQKLQHGAVAAREHFFVDVVMGHECPSTFDTNRPAPALRNLMHRAAPAMPQCTRLHCSTRAAQVSCASR